MQHRVVRALGDIDTLEMAQKQYPELADRKKVNHQERVRYKKMVNHLLGSSTRKGSVTVEKGFSRLHRHNTEIEQKVALPKTLFLQECMGFTKLWRLGPHDLHYRPENYLMSKLPMQNG